MVQFKQLKLNGFKSFADNTVVDIEDGLTGVVGPNGCGKSNLVEAVRWVMGEASAKRMRGSGMEDVIFAGTSDKSSKNRAEVTLILDNPYKDAPAPFQNLDEIEVTRIIERDNGSQYRVNGKAVRARDIQMFFADIVSGANSPALVSQGRVTIMINAKPTERRQILEESAGISGLYVRRHEAELRLRAAENNLIRLDDIMGNLETRYSVLQKQIRQANRYKNLSQTIRDLDALSLYLEWKKIDEDIKSFKSEHEDVERQIAELMRGLTQATTEEASAAEKLPEIRKKNADIAAKVQSFMIEKQRKEDALNHIKQDMEKAQTSLKQTQDDKSYEEEMIQSQTASIHVKQSELKALKEQETNTGHIKALEKKVEDLKAALKEKETKRDSLRDQISNLSVEGDNLTARLQDYEATLKGYEESLEQAQNKLQTLEGDSESYKKIEALAGEITEEEETLIAYKQEREKLEKTLTQQQKALSDAKSDWHEKNTEKEKLLSEINVLENLLNVKNEDNHVAVLEKIKPSKGYEVALAKSLGDTLLAALEDTEANQYWKKLSHQPQDLPELSASLEALSTKVKAPEALSICLSQIGVITDDAVIDDAVQTLKPGQMAVTKDGDVYRWDGYVITAKSQSATGQHLERKNNLENLKSKFESIEAKADKAKALIDKEQEELSAVETQFNALRTTITELEQSLSTKRQKLSQLKSEYEEQNLESARLKERIETLQNDIEKTRALVEQSKTKLAGFDNDALEKLNAENETIKDDILSLRTQESEAVRELDQYRFTLEKRDQRIAELEQDLSQTEQRINVSKERIETLSKRKAELTETIEGLKARPDDLEKELESLLDKISGLDEEKRESNDTLNKVETEVATLTKQVKEKEASLSSLKEKRAIVTTKVSGHKERLDDVLTRIEEAEFTTPQALLSSLEWPEDKAFPSFNDIKDKLEKAKRDRDNIGPVNLMAAQEAEEAATEIETMTTEREDLVEAISKLRQAIQKLNKEARQRMEEAFENVNEQYQRLFTQLFGGGQAYLKLTDSDDILEAGLEIFAQPPGKKLQNLTLLSGGEQTLASIALIFAMFLTKPAPICVLDEIDAPLDDANVDRVCNMLDEITKITNTRFLVITHHRMTMARMDRLYGVTMAEKGISQLVSVDLQQNMFDQLEAAE